MKSFCSGAIALLIATVTAVSHAAPKTEQAPSRPPNIVFILADDLGYADIGCYGQKQIATPNLDRLAKEGVRFTQFYAGAPVCAPSRNVLMTGQHTGHAYIRGNAKFSLRNEDTTVAQVLKRAGYVTGLIGKWGLGSEGSEGTPNKKGFDYFFGYIDQTHAHNSYPTFLIRNEERVPLRNVVPNEGRYGEGVATQRLEHSEDLMAADALRFLEAHRDEPFFLYLAVTLPHANNQGGIDGMESPAPGPYANTNWPEAEKRFAAIVDRLDRDVGRVVEKIKSLGLDENTLVIFTSDNGPHREGGHDSDFFHSSGPLRGIKRDVYEGGIRVPMIARWPGHIKPDTESNHIAYLGDFMTTAAELAGTAAPTNLDSISFLPALLGKNESQPAHPFLYWEFYEGESSQAVRMGRWKGVRIPMLTGAIQLFDLESDPGEQHDLASANPDLVSKVGGIMAREHVPSPLWRAPAKLVQFFPNGATSAWELITPDKTPLAAAVTAKPDGVVSIAGKPVGYLQTTAAYSDYQLHAEWRWSEKPGNAGILVHISSGPVDRNLWPVCLQIQTKHSRAGDLLPMAEATFAEPLSAGGDSKTKVLSFTGPAAELPVGTWNSCDIVCRGDMIEVSINGIPKNRVSHCVPAAGRIGFQLEGTPYELRNVWMRPLN